MAGCFILGELPEELRIIGHDDVPDPVIMSCLSQMQLTDHCYEKSTSLVASRAANDRSSPHSCVRAGKSPRHEHGPPVPGDRDFRQEADSIFLNCTLATELQGLKKMLRVMGEAKEELLGSLSGPGSIKRRIAPAEEDEDVGKLFSEWRLVGRTLRPIDNNVVAGDSFKLSSLAQNLKGENQFFEPLVFQPDKNAKADHQFFEPLVAYSTNESSEPTKPSQGGDTLKPAAHTTANMKKSHGFEPQSATFLNELSDSTKSALAGDSLKPSSVASHHNKENPVFDPPVFHPANELSESTKSVSRKAEDRPQKLDRCHVQVSDASLCDDGVTSQTVCQDRKETRKLIEERDTVLRLNRAPDHSEEEDTTSSDTAASSDTLTTEEEDSACNLKIVKGSGAWMSKKTSPEYLREERILNAAIEAGVSYFHDGVVYRENLIYDMLRSPSSGTQEDILDSNHDLEEFQKPAPRKKSYNPELFSLSNDHFLEAFERSLAELDPKDTIDQETFASVTRHTAEPEPVFHQFNFASLVNYRVETENLPNLDPPPPFISPVPTAAATPARDAAGPLANLDDSSPLLTDSAKEMNQFFLDEEASRDSADEGNQFFLEGETLGDSVEEVKQFLLEEQSFSKDPFNFSVRGPTTPEQGAEVNPPPRKEHRDTARILVEEFNRARIVEEPRTTVASAIRCPKEAAATGAEVAAGNLVPSSEPSGAAPGMAQVGPALLIVPLDDLQGTAKTYQEELKQRRASLESERVVRPGAADTQCTASHRSSLSLPNLEELNANRLGESDRGNSGHLEPLNDRSNIPTDNADDLNQRSRPRPKTITDFFNPSEMTLRRPSTIEPRKKDKSDIKSSLRTPDQKSPSEVPVDLRFALPPPSARSSSRRHSLSEKSLEIAGLALTPIRVPSRDRVCAIHGVWDQSQGSCSLCSHGAPKKRGESRVFGVAGSKSPQMESTPHKKIGESASPFGVAGSQSPYGKTHTSFLKKGGGSPSPSGLAPGSKTPQTPQSTTSSGSEASPKQNPFKRNSGIYSSLVPREKRSGDGSSVLFNTSRLSTSVNLPSSSRMSTSVNLPSSSERLGNQRQSTSKSNFESLPPGSLRKSPAQDIKPTPLSKPSFSTSTTLAKSRTLPSTTTTAKEKLTPGAARRTQSVKDRVTR
ncbi:hypothetical protein MPTK1_7g16650 [Marchantia polymorpha subsp. ruderalis]|uniref:Uncharacterized protein n=4 Tax=Marchantia polymorpha TaxID=3197 RepID=A0AAF6C0F4_MARPO|nr:hypothetical protein Mp_7g16650 [Marchantia polymorpha subsp. ruderalis]